MQEKSSNSFIVKDGAVEIKDGVVSIYDPEGEGCPAIIINDPMSVILINGEALDTSREVWSTDKVEIIPKEERNPGSVQVELAEGGMVAKIKVTPGTSVKRKVKDVPPTFELILSYEEETAHINEVTVEDVQAALKEAGVVFGIDLQQVEKAVREASGQFEIVARGEEVKNGRDGYVELLFVPEIKVSYDQEDLSRVDYKEKIAIPAVNEGDDLAIIHLPLPGTPGRLVTGEVLEPPPVREINVRCKSGCIITQGGDKVYATCTGRPLVEGRQNDIFRVVPIHIHQGDVDVKSGNLRFHGEMKITGSVLEGMTVESLGNLEVQGNTAGAQVISGGSIVFRKNLINSKVVAGIMKEFYLKIDPLLEEIENIFSSLNSGIAQLRETLKKRGEKIEDKKTGYLIKLFIARKYETLPELLKNLIKVSKENRFSLPSQIGNALQEVEQISIDTGFSNIRGEDDLKRIIQSLTAARSYIEKSQEIQGDIIASYIQNSSLVTCGNITIQGTGCYNSYFKAGGDIQIRGVFRGGEITSGGQVYIGEAGSPGLLLKQGKINLSTNSEAKFRKIYENVQLTFGKRSYKFEETRSMVKVFYSTEEDLVKIVHI